MFFRANDGLDSSVDTGGHDDELMAEQPDDGRFESSLGLRLVQRSYKTTKASSTHTCSDLKADAQEVVVLSCRAVELQAESRRKV